MNKRTILIVPPRGVPLKAFRIRLSVAIFLLAIITIGLAGLLLPLEALTDDVAEQNQRRNITEQNKELLQRVLSTLRMLKDLKEQVVRLEEKRGEIKQVTGSKPRQEPLQLGGVDYTRMRPDELLTIVEKIETRFVPYGFYEEESGNVFDSLPVIPPVVNAPVSRRFGMAIDPFSGKKRHHNGTDFIAEPGTAVIATASGVVQRIERHPIWGKRIYLRHSETFTTVYAHLGEIRTTQGKRVRRGEIIGEIGMSGLSSGPHVHYEILYDGNHVDPEAYVFPAALVAGRQ
jgi:murein DD-endopeptidase MepM/ murein hydrolase activator NlpD